MFAASARLQDGEYTALNARSLGRLPLCASEKPCLWLFADVFVHVLITGVRAPDVCLLAPVCRASPTMKRWIPSMPFDQMELWCRWVQARYHINNAHISMRWDNMSYSQMVQTVAASFP